MQISKKRITQIKLILSAVLVIVIITALSIALINKYKPNETVMALKEYYYVDASEAMLILEDAIYPENAKLLSGGEYISLELVQSLFNDEFYFDEAEGVLEYALPTELIQARYEDSFYTSNQEKKALKSPAVKKVEDKAYLSMEFIQLFSDMEYQFYQFPNRVVVSYLWTDALYCDTIEGAPLRFEPDIKSEILMHLSPNTRLRYIGGTGASKRSFLRVMTEDGIYGYIQNKYVGQSYYYAKKSNYQKPEYPYPEQKEKIRLGWHQVVRKEQNQNLEKLTKNAASMNVIIPTWYRISDASGEVSSLAEAAYVEKAHELGLKVWALIDNFDKSVDCHQLFTSTAARTKLVDYLIAEAKQYRFDGINLDFESLSSKTGVHYIQFIKELSIKCRNNGIILSVDNYVPATYNTFYDLETQGEFVDYIIIMAYDEHYGGSKEAGSVSSIGFVRDAIQNTLKLAPKERVIIAVPFYTRLWKLKGTEKIEVSAETLSMSQAETVILQNGIKTEWDTKTAQYYGEYKKDDIIYKIWLEEESSLKEKLYVISDFGVSGVAGWRLGLENEGIWQLIETYIK